MAKIKVNLGSASFEAEGSEESVTKKYEQFLEALRTVAVDREDVNHARSTIGYTPLPNEMAQGMVTSLLGSGAMGGSKVLSGAELRRHLFRVSDDGVVYLYPKRPTLPESTRIIILLYGFHALQAQKDILAADLLKASELSGAPIDRVDRAIGSLEWQVEKTGIRKGSRYRLTDVGLRHAESFIKLLVENE